MTRRELFALITSAIAGLKAGPKLFQPHDVMRDCSGNGYHFYQEALGPNLGIYREYPTKTTLFQIEQQIGWRRRFFPNAQD